MISYRNYIIMYACYPEESVPYGSHPSIVEGGGPVDGHGDEKVEN